MFMPRMPSPGDHVNCPPDRGEKGYRGQITHVGTEVYHTADGMPYVWLTVKGPSGTKHLWPSTRFGYRIP